MNTANAPLGLRRETLATSVRSEIERRILAGDLASGEKLNEAVLADSLAVSRGTVREAIRSLVDSGLIVLKTNRGAYVRTLTVDEIRNLYDLRGAVFAMACSATARRMGERRDDMLIATLKRNLEDMRKAYQNDDRSAYYELNIAFHALLLDASHNSKAKAVYESLVKEMHLFRRRGLSIAMNIARSIEEHSAIVDAVIGADPGKAREEAILHIESGLERFLKTLSDAGQLEEQGQASNRGDEANQPV